MQQIITYWSLSTELSRLRLMNCKLVDNRYTEACCSFCWYLVTWYTKNASELPQKIEACIVIPEIVPE